MNHRTIKMALLVTLCFVRLAGTANAQALAYRACVNVTKAAGGYQLKNNCGIVIEVAFVQPGGGLDEWFQMLKDGTRNVGLDSKPYDLWVCKDPSYPFDTSTRKVPRFGSYTVTCHNAGEASAAY